jgi:hypothetical protein
MPFLHNPSGRTWNQIAEDLRELQGIVDSYRHRFQAADHPDIAVKLESCILKLMSAEGVAKTIDMEERDAR